MEVRGIRVTPEMLGMPNAALKLGSVWPLPVEFCRSLALGNCEGNCGSWLGNCGAAVTIGVNPVEDMALDEALLNVRAGGGNGGVCPLDGVW